MLAQELIPVSVVIPTRNRWSVLFRTLHSLAEQSHIPKEIIVIDASEEVSLHPSEFEFLKVTGIDFKRRVAEQIGAAIQRVQGVRESNQPIIWFMDDDILLEPDCTRYLFEGMSGLHQVGGVNAMITNQQYHVPGMLTRKLYALMHGQKIDSYAGKVIGPAWNILPEDNPALPAYVPCEWLNTTCTMYWRSCLPTPLFDPIFRAYSFMEDVALSVEVGKSHNLFNARLAKIFHDSQPGDHKANRFDLSRMEIVNRYWVMTRVLNRRGPVPVVKLLTLECFWILTSLKRASGWRSIPIEVAGKCAGLWDIWFHRFHARSESGLPIKR